MEPLVNCEKGSSKKCEPFLSMLATWFMGAVSYLNSLLYRCSIIPKNILALMFKNILSMCFEINAQNVTLKISLGNHSFLFLLLKLAIGSVEV